MDTQETLLRLGLSLAIGLLVGIERHWREREAQPGQRTAGLRTFGLIGLLGGVTGLIAQQFPAGSEMAAAMVIGAIFLGFAAALILFKRAEARQDENYSVTTVIAGLLVFALGVVAVLGDKTVAAASGVAMMALLASREVLHGLLKRLTWEELRSAVIILVMTFIALPLVPRTPVGPFGGVDLAETWTLAILMAVIAFGGYIAIRLLGPQRGLLLAGALGGLASSTAVTVTHARRSSEPDADARALAAGSAAASGVSILRIGALAVGLSPALLPALVLPIGGGAIGFLAAAALTGFRAAAPAQSEPYKIGNPFDIGAILRLTALLTAASFLVKASIDILGVHSLVPTAALAGLADADAVVLSVTRLPAGTVPVMTATLAVLAAIGGDIVAKSVFAATLGSRAYGLTYVLAALLAIFGALVGYAVTVWLPLV